RRGSASGKSAPGTTRSPVRLPRGRNWGAERPASASGGAVAGREGVAHGPGPRRHTRRLRPCAHRRSNRSMSASLPGSTLDLRSRQLLRTLIARYIRDGEPVGSQTLARHAGLDVSAATIRNILGDLEEQGLLAAPHTSAGRVPTAQGYRVFVDSLLQVQPLAHAEMARLRGELAAGGGTQSLLGSASELVSAMTHFVGVV